MPHFKHLALLGALLLAVGKAPAQVSIGVDFGSDYRYSDGYSDNYSDGYSETTTIIPTIIPAATSAQSRFALTGTTPTIPTPARPMDITGRATSLTATLLEPGRGITATMAADITAAGMATALGTAGIIAMIIAMAAEATDGDIMGADTAAVVGMIVAIAADI